MWITKNTVVYAACTRLSEGAIRFGNSQGHTHYFTPLKQLNPVSGAGFSRFGRSFIGSSHAQQLLYVLLQPHDSRTGYQGKRTCNTR